MVGSFQFTINLDADQNYACYTVYYILVLFIDLIVLVLFLTVLNICLKLYAIVIYEALVSFI